MTEIRIIAFKDGPEQIARTISFETSAVIIEEHFVQVVDEGLSDFENKILGQNVIAFPARLA